MDGAVGMNGGAGNKGAALIVNPHSGGTNRSGLRLAEMVRHRPGVRAYVLERFAQLDEALAELAATPPEALFISSGDGTIQYVQTWLIERSGLPRERWPVLALLPHGSTNMTAADIGYRSKDVREQAATIAEGGWRRAGARFHDRATVRLANPASDGPLHGMFLGGGVLAEATLFCRDTFNRKGLRGHWGPLLTMLSVGLKAIFRPAGPEDVQRIDRPQRMRVVVDNEPLGDGWQVAVLATTLNKLVLNARPFWGPCTGAEQRGETPDSAQALRVSLFNYPYPFLLRWLPVVLWGGTNRRVHASMHSRCASRVEVATQGRFVLDGEEVHPPAGEPLIIERGPTLRYLLG